eukprot:jgi/Phyca11/17341/fgenesh1_pg.PHYCAscaffold_27_\
MTDSTPPTLLQGVEGIYRRAYNMGKTCQALAYPWEGSKVWYDPVENELLHVAHWRFWMANRVRFFEWQLNMPYRIEFKLQEKKDKNEYDLPKIPPLRVNEEGHPGYSPIKHRDGTFMALQAAPLEKPIDERDSDSFEPDSSDEDEVEVIETKAPAPKFAPSGHKWSQITISQSQK